MNGPNKILAFPTSPDSSLRSCLNDSFQDLQIDPLELIFNTKEAAFKSIYSILESAEMHASALAHINQRYKEEFQTIVPFKEVNTSIHLIIEEGTGNRTGVIPISFLANLGKQILAVSPDTTQEQAVRRSSRIANGYALGLLAYDEIDPWRLGENELVDTVSARLAAGLLCTGIDDGAQQLAPRLRPHYMRHTLPKRFASAIAYLDFEKSLRDEGIAENDARITVEAFMERRMTAVYNVRQDGTLAVSDIDHAFAHPLAEEELQSFIMHASMLRVRGLIRALK